MQRLNINTMNAFLKRNKWLRREHLNDRWNCLPSSLPVIFFLSFLNCIWKEAVVIWSWICFLRFIRLSRGCCCCCCRGLAECYMEEIWRLCEGPSCVPGNLKDCHLLPLLSLCCQRNLINNQQILWCPVEKPISTCSPHRHLFPDWMCTEIGFWLQELSLHIGLIMADIVSTCEWLKVIKKN